MTTRYSLALPYRHGSIRLRQMRIGDFTPFLTLRNDAELGRYQSWASMSSDQVAQFVADQSQRDALLAGEWTQLTVTMADGDELIGDVGLHLNDTASEAEFGITIAPGWQGRGLGTQVIEALLALLFEATPVERVLALVDARNHASRRVMQKAGLREIDIRQAEYKGEMCTEHVYAAERSLLSLT